MNGAAAMVRCLEAEGITRIFGYPGVAIAPFYEEVFASGSIEHVLVRQEQAAGHAASGYARIARKPAVCVTSSGPGAANLITALATAYADSIPMVAITGQVNSSLLGRDVFQEADMRGATESFVKYSYLVKNPDEIPRIMKEAFYIASTGRKGPVLIDIPCDVQMASLKKPFSYPQEVKIRGYKPSTRGNDQQMNKVIAAIRKAERPLVCAGGGVILGNAEACLRQFCEKNQIPLVTTMMGIGVLPKAHPLYFGMLGNNGKPYANRAVSASDLLIIVGARIADRAVPRPQHLEKQVNIIHIDIDTAEIGKNLGPTIPLVGGCRGDLRASSGRGFFPGHGSLDPGAYRDQEKHRGPPDLQQPSGESQSPSAAFIGKNGSRRRLCGRCGPEPALVCGQLCDEKRTVPYHRRHGYHGLLHPGGHWSQNVLARGPGGGGLR